MLTEHPDKSAEPFEIARIAIDDAVAAVRTLANNCRMNEEDLDAANWILSTLEDVSATIQGIYISRAADAGIVSERGPQVFELRELT
ncbi:hypothetical protein ACX80N_04010 [Arthrobacter sp. MDT2-16]